MKLKFMSVCIAAIYFLNFGSGLTASAMNAADKIMVIEDFESYSSTSDMLSGAFLDGRVSGQSDTAASASLDTAAFYNGSKGVNIGGTFTPSGGSIGGMVHPYLLVPEGKRDWTNAEYLQFWVKNTEKRSLRLALKLQAGDESTTYSMPTSTVYYLETNPGEGAFKESYGSDHRLLIPAEFEGLVRVSLSQFEGSPDFKNIKVIYLGMNVNDGDNAATVSGLTYDYFHVVTADYEALTTVPVLLDTVVRIDEKNHQLKISATVQSYEGEETFFVNIYNSNNKMCTSEIFTSDTEGKAKVNYVAKLPASLPAGNYKLKIMSKENPDFLYEYMFPVYGEDMLCCNDILNEKSETYVEFLHKLGILPGYSDGSFKPSQPVTYGELIDALAKMSKLSASVIKGYAETEISENDEAEYNVMLKMIMKTLGYTEESDSAYASRASNLLVTGTLGFTRSSNTRGNAAIMLARALYAEIQLDGAPAKINLLNKNFESEMDTIRYNAAVNYGDLLLKYDKDAYGKTASPLFIDGMNVATKQPAQYSYDGVTSTMSNFSSQQNTLRTLDALSSVTGNSKYVNRAKEVIRYTLSNITDSNGVPYMGGHTWWDVARERVANTKTRQIEMKFFFPYYDLWYKTDSTLATRAIDSIWDSFMTDWSRALFSRHGSFNKSVTQRWDSEWANPEPWYKAGSELPFFLTGADLAVAGYKEKQYTGNTKPATWAKQVIEMYRKAADEETHLFPDIFVLSGGSEIRDRGLDQFEADFPETTYGFRATEGNIQGTNHTTADAIPEILSLYDDGLIDDETFTWFVEDYIGYLDYQYDAEKHKNKYILNDGTDLEGYVLKKDGYFGSQGSVLKSEEISRTLLYNAVGLYTRTQNTRFWDFARNLALYYGLGDIGEEPGKNVSVNLATHVVNPGNVFAMCELYNKTGCEDYLKLAKAIANNYIIYMKRGFFMTPDEKSIIQNWKYNKVYANFDDKDAWAILMVSATMDRKSDKVPAFSGGYGNVLDDFDGFRGGDDPYNRKEPGAIVAIYRGEYNIDSIMDYNLKGDVVAGQPSDNTAVSFNGLDMDWEVTLVDPGTDYTAIVALYDSFGNMVGLLMPTSKSESYEYDMKKISFKVTMTEAQAQEAETTKCLVWSMENLFPYTHVKKFNVEK